MILFGFQKYVNIQVVVTPEIVVKPRNTLDVCKGLSNEHKQLECQVHSLPLSYAILLFLDEPRGVDELLKKRAHPARQPRWDQELWFAGTVVIVTEQRMTKYRTVVSSRMGSDFNEKTH